MMTFTLLVFGGLHFAPPSTRPLARNDLPVSWARHARLAHMDGLPNAHNGHIAECDWGRDAVHQHELSKADLTTRYFRGRRVNQLHMSVSGIEACISSGQRCRARMEAPTGSPTTFTAQRPWYAGLISRLAIGQLRRNGIAPDVAAGSELDRLALDGMQTRVPPYASASVLREVRRLDLDPDELFLSACRSLRSPRRS